MKEIEEIEQETIQQQLDKALSELERYKSWYYAETKLTAKYKDLIKAIGLIANVNDNLK